MNIFLNTKYIPKLIVNNKYFKCQIGKNGIVPIYKKKEGDGCTPFGKWKLNNIYFRSDKSISLKFKTHLKKKVFPIKNTYIWCDDVNSSLYNKFFKKKSYEQELSYTYENLFRKDEIYDIIIELNYNQNPTIKKKGSAIFIHCSSAKFKSTLGCVALKKNHLKFLINNLQKENYIYIR
tara:strand:+ start:585 stop:1118 length:534 start_codon:yes stop_codon:yes gene_type:complete